MSAVPPNEPIPPATPAATAPADPFSPGLQKLAASSGIAAAVLMFVSVIVNSAEVPDFTAPAAEWAQYVADDGDAAKLGGFLLLLASFFLVFYAGIIRAALGTGEAATRGFVRLGFIVIAGLTLAATCFGLGGAMTATLGALEGAEPEVAKTFGHLSGAVFAPGMLGLAAALDAAGFIILRTRVFPAWLGWVALASAVFAFLTSFFALDAANDDNVFGIFYPLAFLTLLVWLIATSILLIQRVGREPVVVQRYE
jgi:hypothetical protein